MRIALATWGTRGDVQPFVCLARALAGRGHDVQLVAPRNGEQMARRAGLAFRALPFDLQSMMRAEPAQRMLAAGRFRAFARWLDNQTRAHTADMHGALISATESADLIVCNGIISSRCRAIAEARRIAIVPVHLFPLVPSRTHPSPFLPQRNFGPLNRISHELPFQMLWRADRDGLAALRRELGLEPPTRSMWKRVFSGRHPCLLGYSQVLFPAPGDWPANLHPAGFIQPWPELRAQLGEVGIPTELETWLEAGPAPVFLGFGSMPILDERAMLRTIRAALADLGVRGIVAAGWSEFESAGDDALFLVDEVDHQSLLPRCAAAVHHGGAGTVAASVGAGTPTLVCSVFADQPFWGARCRELGVGDTFPFAKLDARRLTEGLRAVLAPRVAKRAEEVARRMANEDGVGAAVEYLCNRPRSEGGYRERRPIYTV